MQDIIKEYGPAMITVVVIGAMLILVSTLIGKDQNSIVVFLHEECAVRGTT